MLRSHLGAERNEKECQKNQRAYGVAQVQLHRQGVAAGFAERGRENLDYPERDCDLGYFAERVVIIDDVRLLLAHFLILGDGCHGRFSLAHDAPLRRRRCYLSGVYILKSLTSMSCGH